MKKKLKNILGYVIVFVVSGIIFTLVGVYAATQIPSLQVTYTNNSQSTVQGALDTLYTRSNTWVNPSDMGTPTRYLFGKPTTSSPTTPPSGKNVYVGLYADNQYGVCIKRNGTQHCFRYDNWIAEAKHVQKVFSDISCTVISSYVTCDASDFFCNVGSDGVVGCCEYSDDSDDSYCEVYGDGSVYCY